MKLIILVVLLSIGQALNWFQLFGSQKIAPYDFLTNKVFLILLAIPIGMLFMTAAKTGTDYFNGLVWPVRILTFSIGNIIFFTLSYFLLHESMSMKSIICLFLSFLIILIQILWK